jgi:hypothetical protein
MSAVKAKLGKRACPVCGEPLHVRCNDAGTVSIACTECDFHGYAKKGTVAARKLTEGFATPAASTPAAPVATKKAEPSKPAGFSLGQL